LHFAAFLSAVADRFGFWGKYGGWGNFATFTQYAAQVNSFMPAFMIPFLAWAATAAELSLGITLIIGIRLRWVAFGTATLLPWLFPSASNLRWITRYFPRPRERSYWLFINRDKIATKHEYFERISNETRPDNSSAEKRFWLRRPAIIGIV
jgi:hypothetical protein